MSESVFKTYYGVLLVLQIAKAVSGKLVYVPYFYDVKSCDNFDNDCFDLHQLIFSVAGDSGEEDKDVGMCGPMNLKCKITKENEMSMDVSKCTEMGEERMFSAVTNICESMKDKDAPWAAMFEMMNISSCPIPEDTYMLNNFAMTLSTFEKCLNKDWCGGYNITVKVTKEAETLSCHCLGLEIKEKEVPDD